NNELVAVLGNFVNRAMVLTHKYFDGVVPQPGELTEAETKVAAEVEAAKNALTEAIETFHFREALKQAMEIARIGNRYLQESEPWKLAKTDMGRVATILYTAVNLCADLAVACEPFLPFAAARLAAMLRLENISWSMIGTNPVAPGTQLGTPELLFEKIEDEAIAAQMKRLEDIKKQNQIANFKPEPQAPEIDFETFEKADLRVGTVLECEKVKKSNKILKFLIDDGMEKRIIVSGIAQHYDPKDLVGTQVCFIANLAPRKIMGIESRGMILSAMNADGRLVLIAPRSEVAAGAQIK
ncbi:MAG: methionine--tRNA ligase subunit beta, partial [Paramuribaculum sp.]|nr:methionine--tRNA ligase subunit beta [Paramuribaculum sp.]